MHTTAGARLDNELVRISGLRNTSDSMDPNRRRLLCDEHGPLTRSLFSYPRLEISAPKRCHDKAIGRAMLRIVHVDRLVRRSYREDMPAAV